MGLLDMFSGNDPQQMGLLSAAAQMLQASGPSLMPHSFGQIAGQGVMAGLQASDQARQSQQMQALRGLQMDELKGSLADKDKARKDILDAQAFMAQRRAGATPAAPMPAPQSADALFKATMGATQPSLPSPGQALTTGGLSPDYLQSLPTVNAQPSAPQQPAPAPGQMPQTLDVFKQRMDDAQWMRSTGNPILAAQADKLEEQALKFRPKYDMTPHVVMGPDGKPILVQTSDDGTVRPISGGYGVAEKLNFQDLGDKVAGLDPFTGKAVTSLGKSQSPDSAAADRREAENQDAPMDDLTAHMLAEQALAGDTSALQNYGRGAQGARNLNKVRGAMTKMAAERGMTGADIAAKVAEFAGTKAGQRTAATRSAGIEIAANEVAQLAPLALEASAKVARSSFLPFGKAQIMFDTNTNNADLRQFAMANTALANAYGQAMARGGTASVADKEHAKELLGTAMNQESYAAAVSQLQKEIKTAQAAPKAVRKSLSADVTGKDESASQTPGQFSVVAPNGKTYTFSDAKSLANFKLSAGIR